MDADQRVRRHIELIHLVRDHPVLYDPMHQYYTRSQLKDELWDEISNKLNFSRTNARECWEGLTALLKYVLYKQKKTNNQLVDQWLVEMDFLIPFMTNRKSISNSDNILKETDPKESSQPENKENASDLMNKKNEGAKHELGKNLTWHTQLGTHLQQDPLYQFFMIMYNSTKEMPVRNQLQIRKTLFLAVSEQDEILQK